MMRIVQQWAMYKYDPKVKALVTADVQEVEAKTREIDAKQARPRLRDLLAGSAGSEVNKNLRGGGNGSPRAPRNGRPGAGGATGAGRASPRGADGRSGNGGGSPGKARSGSPAGRRSKKRRRGR
jgi:hypothetical protein